MTFFQLARQLALAPLVAWMLAAPAYAASDSPQAADAALPLVHAPKHPGAPPVIVVVAQGTAVLSDFVVPYGVLAQSGAAKVLAVNVAEGPLKAGPITVLPDMSAAEFDRAYPEGADYVIVPATADRHDEELAWLRAQHAHGAALVAICDGVELLAETGALDGHRATGHWASLPDRRKNFPRVAWLTNLRYVSDGDVASSAGVSASLPISLALVARIAGPQVARSVASSLGVQAWGAAHDSDVFRLRPSDLVVHTANMHVEREETVAIAVRPGDSEVALSLHAEAWSRTMRNQVRVVTDEGGTVRLRGGLRVQAQSASSVPADVHLSLAEAAPAGSALQVDLDQIAGRYGSGTARLAALGVEYPWGDLTPTH